MFTSSPVFTDFSLLNIHSNPVQTKDQRYGEDRIQPNFSRQNLGAGFGQFGNNRSQTSLKNENPGNEFSPSFNQFGNAKMST